MLDDLGQPGAEFPVGQGVECVGINEYQLRLVERADQVLALRVINAGFSANRGIDLRQQRRRHLDEIYAAHVAGGGETGDVANNAAAERNHGDITIGPRLDERVENRLHCRDGLERLAVGQVNARYVALGKVGQQLFVVQRCNRFVADDQAVSAANEFSKIEAAVQQTAADDDRVAAIS